MIKEIEELDKRLHLATARGWQAITRGMELLKADPPDIDAIIAEFETVLAAMREIKQLKVDASYVALAYGKPAGSA